MNTVIPAVGRGSSAILVASAGASNRIKTDVKIVFASGSASSTEMTLWMKNVGPEKVTAIDQSDLFLTTPTEVKRIPYNSGAEYWTYTVEDGGSDWIQGVTVKVTITLLSVATGTYSVNFIVPNGSSATKDFSV